MAIQNVEEKLRPKASPTGLKYSGTVEGFKIYSSDKLQEEFINIINYARVLSPIRETIKDLIDRGIIFPCYTSGGAIRWFIEKTKTQLVTKSAVLAFYTPATNKIYATFDHQWHTYGMDESVFSRILIHELQHFSAFNIKNTYYSAFKKLYIEWYQQFWNLYFDTINVKKESCDKQAQFLTRIFEWKNGHIDFKKFIIEYKKIVENIARQAMVLENPEIKMRIDEFFEVIEVFWNKPSKYSMGIASQAEPYWMFYKSCLNAYKRTGYKARSTSLFIQELFVPSEIASITSEHPNSTHFKIINSLKNKKFKTYQ